MTLGEIDERIPGYRQRGLFIDANLLLLYLVGELDPRLITRFKRTREYEIRDFRLLKAITDFFPVVVTLPGVLTEVSNLAGHLEGHTRLRFFARFAERIQTLREDHVESRAAARQPTFQKLGLTDSAIILACKDRYLAITADILLVRFMEANRLDVINFSFIRHLDWE